MDAVQEALVEFGITVTVNQANPTVNVTLSKGPNEQRYELVHERTTALTHTKQPPTTGTAPQLVFRTRISEASARLLRETATQYIDAAGNANLHFGDVTVDVWGRKPLRRSPVGAPTTGANLFSTKRAQVVFALLSWPDLLAAPITAIADASGVSVGQAHSAIRLLVDGGHMTAGPDRMVTDPDRLADLWVGAYPTGLGRKLELAAFTGEFTSLIIPPGVGPFYLGAQSAVPDLLRPTVLVAYVNRLDPDLVLANRWRSDGVHNILIRRAFWTEPEATTPDRNTSGAALAPPLLVYADLATSSDPRLREAAETMKKAAGGLHQVRP